MNETAEAKQRWIDSAEAWIDGMRRGDTNRMYLLDPVMLDCLGDVAGRRIIDIGCGEGRFARMLAARGATVAGLDLTPSLVAEARRMHPEGRYIAGSAEELPFETGAFDAAVSYVVLVDVPDYRRAIIEMARVLKSGGLVVVANVNSFASTSQAGWYRDADGRKLHFPVDRYFEERALLLKWDGMAILNWHRPLQSYMSAYLDSGLTLRKFIEPAATPEDVAREGRMVDETRIALFNVMVWQKPCD